MSWRRAWDVDVQGLTATHRGTGFVVAFEPVTTGGYTARIGCELPPFGPDGEQAMAQMFGLRQLLKDGWEIFHTVARKGGEEPMTGTNAYHQLRLAIEKMKDQGYAADLYPERGPYTWGWSNERLGLRSTKLGYPRVANEMLAWRQCIVHCMRSGIDLGFVLPKE